MTSNIMWPPGLDPATEKDIHEETGEIQIKSIIYLIVLYQCLCFSSDKCYARWLHKMLTLGKLGVRYMGIPVLLQLFHKSKIIQK